MYYSAMARKQPWMMGPLVPLGFVVAYQADLVYGNKMQRIIGESVVHVFYVSPYVYTYS